MDKYLKPIKFHLPGLFRFFKIYETLITLYKTTPELFKDNIIIGSVYGAPGFHIWNGGRIINSMIQRNELEDIKQFMEQANIPVRLTFTNCLIEEKHLNDTFCNATTELFHTELNEIICNSEVLENYLRTNYPKYSFISSTTKVITSIEDIKKELSKDYKLTVLDYKYNNDYKVLENFEDPSKIEILCNSVCFPDCPLRAEHYKIVARAQLENNVSITPFCETTNFTFDKAKKMPHFVTVESINEYTKYGVENFKLDGRSKHPLDLIEILLYYLIKEEDKYEVRALLQKVVW